MTEIKGKILNDLFLRLEESEDISSEVIEELQRLLLAEGKPTAEGLVKAFEMQINQLGHGQT